MKASECAREAADMEAVGNALMDAIEKDFASDTFMQGWHPCDCPSEIVGDLLNRQEELIAEIEKAEARGRLAGIRDAAAVAECVFDDRPNSRAGHHSEMDWTDGYRDATRASAAAITALIPGEPA